MNFELLGTLAAPAPAVRTAANQSDLTYLTTSGRISISAEFAKKLGFELNNSKNATDAKYLAIETNFHSLIDLIKANDGKVKAKLDALKKANPTWTHEQITTEFLHEFTILNVVVKSANDFPEGDATGKVSLVNGEFSSASAWKEIRSILGIPADANVKILLNSEKFGERHIFKLFTAKVENVVPRVKAQ